MGNWITALGLPEVFEGLLCCTTSTLSALCSSCTTAYPRFLFSLFLLFGSLLSFLVLSPNMRSALDKLPYFCTAVTTEEMCDNLVGYGAVYKICFSLAVFYGLFAVLMLSTTSTKDIRCRFHNGYWFLKLVLLVGILVGAFHIPRHTEFGRLLMYVGLTAGFVFIMIQILLVIDFAHSWSFSWTERIESGNSNVWGFALAFSTILIYSMAITMAVFYYLYFTDLQNLSKCRGNMFLITFNVFHCLLASVISILPRIQDTAPGSGLLQSSIVSLYTMYLTWCTLSSEPDGMCNPMGDVILEYDKVSGVNGQAIFDCVLMFALLIFACNVRSSTSKLEKIGFSLSKYPDATRTEHFEKSTFKRYDAEKYIGEENVDDDENVEYNYSFFHFVMFLASLQLMMVVTNWHSPDELADLKKLVKNWSTVWIQLSSSFLCVLFYIWATVTPLLVSTWGSCLGLDYECVPTEDDYERLGRRREMIREHKAMQETLRTEEGKNYREEHDFNNAVLISEQKLGNLSLSSVRNKRGSEQIEQTTDSGMCDVTNVSSRSRSISRASAWINSSKSTVDARLSPASEHRSESALSNRTVNNEKSRTHLREDDVNTEKRDTKEIHALEELRNLHFSYSKSLPLNAKKGMKDLTMTVPRPKSAQSWLPKCASSGKKQKPNSRSYSSMATIDNNFLEDSKASKHGASSIDTKILTSRPKTCEPSLARLQRRVDENDETLIVEEDFSDENTPASNQRYETTSAENIKRRSREIQGESSKLVENEQLTSELSSAKGPVTQKDNINILKSTESSMIQKSINQTLHHWNKEEIDCGEETFKDNDSKLNTDLLVGEKNGDTPSDKVPRTSLKMQDHLKWVKSLRRTRGKVIPLKKEDSSEMEVSVEGRTNSQVVKVSAKMEVKNMFNGSRSRNDMINTGKALDNTAADGENQQQSLRTDEKSNETTSDRFTNDHKDINQSELQTADVSKEILRLQEKILKFQAKVVKTQQRLLEMQQDGDR